MLEIKFVFNAKKFFMNKIVGTGTKILQFLVEFFAIFSFFALWREKSREVAALLGLI